jgi:superfamily II DNA helicase RecQ
MASMVTTLGTNKSIENMIDTYQETSGDLEARALAMLRRYTGKPDAQWTSKLQWQAIAQVYQREEDIIVISTTGSGKTMIGIIPTLLGNDNELAIIVLPLNSLITDYKRKFNNMNILYDTYPTDKHYFKPHSKFVLVSTDATMSSKWPEFLSTLSQTHDISRIIFDESHIPMISTNYRKVMSLLDQLRIHPAQMVLLTGTCPPSSEAKMMELFGLKPASTVIFRGQTDRPELEYIRLPKASSVEKALEHVQNIIRRYRSTADDDARAMVFVPFIENGTTAASKLNCEFYHSNPTDYNTEHKDYRKRLQEKEGMYNAWYIGRKADGSKNDVIVATTALSAGNDHPSVRLVLHLNTPYEMISYVQEVSRGGRDGKPTKCILIPVNTKIPKQDTSVQDYRGLQEMHDYVFKESDCLRYAITKYCDGVGVFCHSNPERQKCSVCRKQKVPFIVKEKPVPAVITSAQISLKRKRHGPGDGSAFMALMEAAKDRKAKREEEGIEYVEMFKMALAFFDSCAYCLMQNVVGPHHTLTTCRNFTSQWQKYKDWKKNSIHYPEKFLNKSCFFCHIPRIGNLLHQNVGKTSDCVYPDIVPVVAFCVYLDGELHTAAEAHFESKWKSLEEYGKWLTTFPKDGNLTNISGVFLWYTKQHFNVF